MADTTDLKSVASNGVRVRVPLRLPIKSNRIGIKKNTKKYIDEFE